MVAVIAPQRQPAPAARPAGDVGATEAFIRSRPSVSHGGSDCRGYAAAVAVLARRHPTKLRPAKPSGIIARRAASSPVLRAPGLLRLLRNAYGGRAVMGRLANERSMALTLSRACPSLRPDVL